MALSWLVCGAGCLGLTAASGLLAVVHAACPRGAPTSWQLAPTGRALVAAAPVPDVEAPRGGPIGGAKLDGTPTFLDDVVPFDPERDVLVAQIPEELVLDVGGALFAGGNGMIFCFAPRAARVDFAQARLAFEGG